MRKLDKMWKKEEKFMTTERQQQRLNELQRDTEMKMEKKMNTDCCLWFKRWQRFRQYANFNHFWWLKFVMLHNHLMHRSSFAHSVNRIDFLHRKFMNANYFHDFRKFIFIMKIGAVSTDWSSFQFFFRWKDFFSIRCLARINSKLIFSRSNCYQNCA